MELTNTPLRPALAPTEVSPQPEPSVPFLQDIFARNGRIPLDRYFEREQFKPWLMAILAAILFFLLFNILGAVVMIAMFIPKIAGSGTPPDVSQISTLLLQDVWGQLVGNTFGQFLGLGLPMLWLARRHSSQPNDFLRLRKPDIPTLAWAVLGLFVLYPVIGLVSMVNGAIPKPQSFIEMDKMREAFILNVLKQSPIWFNLLCVAVTPAICEELLFRGYMQRQFERTFKPSTAILVTGIIFGAYHLSFEQVLPLSFIGIYLCYLTWKTGNLFPAILVHFVNNGFSVVMGGIMIHQKGYDPAKLDGMPDSWLATFFLAAIGLYLFTFVHKQLNQRLAFITPKDAKDLPSPPTTQTEEIV